MQKQLEPISAKFVTTHFVNEIFHSQHSQLSHRHEDVIELLYVKAGHGHYRVNDKEYIIEPGNLIICNGGILHGEDPFMKHNMQSYCCVLKNLKIPELPPNTLTKDSQSPILQLSEDRIHIENLLMALHEYSLKAPVYHEICEMLANTFLNIIYIEVQEQNAHNTATEKNEELIQQILEYLNEHFMEDISLQELGEIFHMSHYHLAHIFKTVTGVSPRKYITHRKIGEAQNLLMNTDLLIGEIIDKIGFNENCHFSSMFKKYVGVTPTQYRGHFKK